MSNTCEKCGGSGTYFLTVHAQTRAAPLIQLRNCEACNPNGDLSRHEKSKEGWMDAQDLERWQRRMSDRMNEDE